ncbi:MAG: helix-turn-helix domain-containing protein [Catenulispora sp.]
MKAGTGGGCVLCRQIADAAPMATFAAVADLPVALEVPAAGRLLGIGRTRAYQMARDGTFPTRVIPIGRSYLVPTADLLRLLGVRLEPDTRRKDQLATANASR